MVAAIFFVLLVRSSQFSGSVAVLGNLRSWPLLIALALSVAGVINRAALARASHRAVGLQVGMRSMGAVSAAAYALNKVVKSGGLGGVALFVRHGARHRRPEGRVTAACVLGSLGSQVALLTMVALTIAAAALSGGLTTPKLVLAGGFAVVSVASLLTAGFVTRRPQMIRWLYARPHAVRASINRRLGRSEPAAPDLGQADHLYEAAELVRRTPRVAASVVAHALAAKLIGAAVLAASIAAVGVQVGIGTVLGAYVLALIASSAAIVPGGLGAVEVSLAAALAGAGLATPHAIAAVLTFRLLDLWLPILVGMAAARSLTASGVPIRQTPHDDPTLHPALVTARSRRSEHDVEVRPAA